MHYLIELKIGGDLDNKKARSEKEALLEQYCILANSLGSEKNIRICFATAYNRYGSATQSLPYLHFVLSATASALRSHSSLQKKSCL